MNARANARADAGADARPDAPGAEGTGAGGGPSLGAEPAAPEPTDDIVLVDDDPMVPEFVRRVLRGSGRTLDAFDDPEAALAHLDGRLARVLIVDMRMPTMSGPELLERLAARGARGGLQVLLCSASRVVEADLPETIELVSKDALLDRRTLLARLGGPLADPSTDGPPGESASGSPDAPRGARPSEGGSTGAGAPRG